MMPWCQCSGAAEAVHERDLQVCSFLCSVRKRIQRSEDFDTWREIPLHECKLIEYDCH